MTVIALLLMGARSEPYLPAVLESIDEAVDLLVVNDNSQDRASVNRRVLEASELFRQGRVDVVEAPFAGFAGARNLCLDHIRAHHSRPDTWILVVDCDEVHGPDLVRLTRRLLPLLPRHVGILDGYFVQLMQVLDYFISLDRRHNLAFRLTPRVRWENDVHERLVGLEGSRLCLPYTYHHYGYVMANSQILEKWQQYQTLGDASYQPEELATVETVRMFEHEVPRCMAYTRRHPPALARRRAQLENHGDAGVARFRELVAQRLAQPWPRLVALLRIANYRLRVVWRAVQAVPVVAHPQAWAILLRMAL